MKTLALFLCAVICMFTFMLPSYALSATYDPVLQGIQITGTLLFDTGAEISEFSTAAIGMQNNDTTVPTGAAIKAYGDANWGSSAAFSGLTSGINTTATMAVGTGATLGYTGDGIINASRYQGVTTVDATEFGYLNGVTSNLQDQINGKQASGNYITALTGDVTASGPGSVAATIANSVVTYAKIQNVSATDKILGRSSAGAGVVQEITCTAAGRALLDDANATAQRSTLELGSAATRAAEDTMTSGSNLPDGAAVITYGNAHWGGGSMVYPGAGIALSTGSAWGTSITNNSTQWNTAYTDRMKWNGEATGLVAATGRASLGVLPYQTTLTDTASYVPTSHAVIVYGDANWGGGGGGLGFAVRPESYGAVVNDGVDDSAAFTAALAAGQTVICSKGTYKFSSGITIPSGKQIIGMSPHASYYEEATSPDANAGTIFSVEYGAGSDGGLPATSAFISMQNYTRLSGVYINYPSQIASGASYSPPTAPTAYPWSIRMSSADPHDISVDNVGVSRAYRFFWGNGGRIFMSNVGGSPIQYGVYIAGGGEIAYLHDVHFVPPGTWLNSAGSYGLWYWTFSNGTAFYIGENAMHTRFDRCFAIHYKYGFYLYKSASSNLISCGADASQNPFYLYNTDKASLIGCQAIASAFETYIPAQSNYHGITLTGPSSSYPCTMTKIVDCTLWWMNGAGVYIASAKNVTIADNLIERPNVLSGGYGGVHVNGFAQALSITGNVISTWGSGGSGVRIASSGEYVTVANNIFHGEEGSSDYGIYGTPTISGKQGGNQFIALSTDVSGTWAGL
jgi:hypothetical protein